jgi:hypothetical protein
MGMDLHASTRAIICAKGGEGGGGLRRWRSRCCGQWKRKALESTVAGLWGLDAAIGGGGRSAVAAYLDAADNDERDANQAGGGVTCDV